MDEARHVAFGRLTLRDVYRNSATPNATSATTSSSKRVT
jgi:hypothetical protein